MTVIFLLAGCLNVKNMLYYSSREYDPDRFDEEKGGFPLLPTLKYSTVCMTREWVVCLDCDENKDSWNSIFANKYYGTATDLVTGERTTLIQRTTCRGAEFQQGIWNLVTLILMILLIALFMWYQSRIEIRLDENKTTASDYTILVSNPPGDALDPEEWREFFEGVLGAVSGCNGRKERQVSLCTIALNNHR